MQMWLLDNDENLVSTLKGVTEPEHREELNGENILEFKTLTPVFKKQRVIYKDQLDIWHEFIIVSVESEHDSDGLLIHSVMAEDSFYETLGDYIELEKLTGRTAQQSITQALAPTRWTAGFIDSMGTKDMAFYHTSSKEAVHLVAEVFEAEIRTRIEVLGRKVVNRFVDLFKQRGTFSGKRFVYNKDIETITRIVQEEEVITALYGYGKGNDIDENNSQGTRITFGAINGGKNYVEDLDALALWGREDPSGVKKHIFHKIDFDDCETPSELLQLTKDKLKEVSTPKITYEADVIDLYLAGMDHERVELGDTVYVIDRAFEPELRVEARVIEIVRDLSYPYTESSVVLGNYEPLFTDSIDSMNSYIDSFRSRAPVWDRASSIPEGADVLTSEYNGNLSLKDLIVRNMFRHTDGAGNIGSSSQRFANIYLTNNPDVSSDERLKNDISEIPAEYLEFIKGVKAKAFTILGEKHVGYIAQEVNDILGKIVGEDLAMVCKDEYMSLIYVELLVLKVQMLENELSTLKELVLKEE